MRKITVFLLILLTVALPVITAAEGSEPLIYTNPETGYRAVIEDEIDLLTEEQEQDLLADMIPLTEYTNVAFWSTEKAGSQSEAEYNSTEKKFELFGEKGNVVLCMIDMEYRYMDLGTWGMPERFIPSSTANSITDNVRSSLRNGMYYYAISSVFDQVKTKMEGGRIMEPMRYMSAIAIGIMSGLLFALLLTVYRRKTVISVYSAAAVAATLLLVNNAYMKSYVMKMIGKPKTSRTYSPVSSSSSDRDSGGGSSRRSGGGSSRSSGGGGHRSGGSHSSGSHGGTRF